MQAVIWVFRLVIVLGFLLFAIKNSGIVTVDFFFRAVEAPLVLVLFVSFGGGVLFGLLILLGSFFSLKKEIASLKREMKEVKEIKDKAPALPEPEAHAP